MMDIRQLEINVNLHAMQTQFLNRELHYVIASDENTFRFAELDELPKENEQRFYCFLTDNELTVPAGNITIRKSYVLDTKPAYPMITTQTDFYPFIDCIGENCTAKAIRNFSDNNIDNIYAALQQRHGNIERHLIKSPEFQHLLIILPQVEISISATMIYFKQRFPVTNEHYRHLKEESME